MYAVRFRYDLPVQKKPRMWTIIFADQLTGQRSRIVKLTSCPKGDWPQAEAPPSASAWNGSLRQMPKENGNGQTVLREALLLANHKAYHVGQMVLLRRLVNAWKD